MMTGQIGAVLVPTLGWQVMFLIGGIPGLVIAGLLLRLPESPRWLIAKGRLEEAEAIIREIEASTAISRVRRRRRRTRATTTPSSAAGPAPRGTLDRAALGRAYRRRTLVVWTLWACAYFITNGLNNWMPTLYNRVYGLSLEQSLRAGTLTNVAQVVAPARLRVRDRSHRPPAAGRSSCFVAGALLLATLGSFAAGFGHRGDRAGDAQLRHRRLGQRRAVSLHARRSIRRGCAPSAPARRPAGCGSRRPPARCWSATWWRTSGIGRRVPDVRRPPGVIGALAAAADAGDAKPAPRGHRPVDQTATTCKNTRSEIMFRGFVAVARRGSARDLSLQTGYTARNIHRGGRSNGREDVRGSSGLSEKRRHHRRSRARPWRSGRRGRSRGAGSAGPGARHRRRRAKPTRSGDVEVFTTDRPGGDFMVDVLKSLELRIRRLEPGLELPRHPRVDHQLRQQPDAGVHHLLPRGVVRGDGPRLLQGRGQADGGAVPRHRRPAARRDGDLQRLLRPRAGLHPRRQHLDATHAAAGRRVGAQRAGRGRDGARLRQVGRHRRCRCRTSPSRPCAPTRSR